MNPRGNTFYLVSGIGSGMMGFYQVDALGVGLALAAAVFALLFLAWLLQALARRMGRLWPVIVQLALWIPVLLAFASDPAILERIGRQPVMWFVVSALSFIAYGLSLSRRQ
jgi:hypothetical protein